MGELTDGSDPTIRVGERERGDLLAVIWSTDLGKKKSELVDALAKLRAEEQLRNRLKKLFNEGAGAGRPYRDAEKDVQSRLVEIAAAERTLLTWHVTDAEIAEIHAEADRLANADELAESAVSAEAGPRLGPRGTPASCARRRHPRKEHGRRRHGGDERGLVQDRRPVEPGGLVHVYEEDLPLVESLPRPIPWTVVLLARPKESFPGTLEKIGAAVIDPAQHTALVMGHVENSLGNLKVGQFVTVIVHLPPPQDELEVPATAVVEDGQQSVIFVQPDAKERRFVRRPVHVVRRFRDTIYVKTAQGGVQAGQQIVTSGRSCCKTP